MLTPQGYVPGPGSTSTGRTATLKYPEIPEPPASEPVTLGNDADLKSLADAYLALLSSSASAGVDDAVEVAPTLVVPGESSGGGFNIGLLLVLALAALLAWQMMGGAS